MTNHGAQHRPTGGLGNQTLTLPRARTDQRQNIAEVVLMLLALLLAAALALRIFAGGPTPTVDTSLLPVGATLFQLGH